MTQSDLETILVYVKQLIQEEIASLPLPEKQAEVIKHFADNEMQDQTGLMSLDHRTFRSFLEKLAGIFGTYHSVDMEINNVSIKARIVETYTDDTTNYNLYITHSNLESLSDYNPKLVVMRYSCKEVKKYEDSSRCSKGWHVAVNGYTNKILAYQNSYVGLGYDITLNPNSEWYKVSGLTYNELKSNITNYYMTATAGTNGKFNHCGGNPRRKAWFGLAIMIENPLFNGDKTNKSQTTDKDGHPRCLFSPVCKIRAELSKDGNVRRLGFGIVD